MKLNLTAIVLTLNEEKNILRCLNSLINFERIIVLDSGSSDSTIQLARRFGADIYINKPSGTFLFSEQRNWALLNCSICTQWALFIDADERVPTPLSTELDCFLSSPATQKIDACYLAPRYIFLKKWLRFSQHYPNWHPRLVRVSSSRFAGGMWETFQDLSTQPLTSSRVAYIKTPYDHIAFSKGLDDWLVKHLRYSDWDAQVVLDYLHQNPLFDKSALSRKTNLRVLSIRLWFLRPILRFIHKYFFSLGFLDGWEGLLFCSLMSFYELLVVIKIIQKQYDLHHE